MRACVCPRLPPLALLVHPSHQSSLALGYLVILVTKLRGQVRSSSTGMRTLSVSTLGYERSRSSHMALV